MKKVFRLFGLFGFKSISKVKKFLFAFSLVELMISLVTISCIAAAFAPVITKKLKSDTITVAASNFESDCSEKFTDKCKFCDQECCYICEVSSESCTKSQYFSTCRCGCYECSANEKFNELTRQKCQTCIESKCTMCIPTNASTGERGYYLNDKNECVLCDAGKTCDGIKMYSSALEKCMQTKQGNQYCDDNGNAIPCVDKWGSLCSTCTKNSCSSCLWWYHVNAKGGCDHCNFGGCGVCPACNGKNGACNSCTACSNGYYLTGSKCGVCNQTFGEKCSRCGSDGCTFCEPGYYYNTNKPRTCSTCNIANCQKCKDGQSASKPQCQTCAPGYYITSSGGCSACGKFGDMCIACDEKKCLACKRGYYVAEGDTTCSVSNGWHCNDANFMRIGNLCYTRRNMGDAPILKLSSKVNMNTSPCYLPYDYCGTISPTSNCDAGNTDYSGCGRTVLDGWAAYATCDEFNYRGLKWHVMNSSEHNQGWFIGSFKKGSDGLMLCTGDSGDGEPTCHTTNNAHLTSSTGIKPGNFPNATPFDSRSVSGNGSTVAYGNNNGYFYTSVRCVADLTGTGI